MFKELVQESKRTNLNLSGYLLFGSLANTNSEGGLGSPTPEMLMADTRNSYSMPSTTSLTAYFLSVGKYKADCEERNTEHVFIQ